jgi:hypothetical protein
VDHLQTFRYLTLSQGGGLLLQRHHHRAATLRCANAYGDRGGATMRTHNALADYPKNQRPGSGNRDIGVDNLSTADPLDVMASTR